jgi:hypothetical protein
MTSSRASSALRASRRANSSRRRQAHSPLTGDIIWDVILHGRAKDYDVAPFRWTLFREHDLVPSARWAAAPHPKRRL